MSMEKAFGELLATLREALGVGDRQSNLATLASVDDWSAVIGLAKRHRVIALMRQGLRHAGVFDREAEKILTPLHKEATIRGLAQLAGLRTAVDCLEQAGIPTLVMKGMPLSEQLYGAPLARENYDIDLLVPPIAVDAAVDALYMNGWKTSTPSWQPTVARNRYFDRYVKNRILSGPGGVLELHHRLVNNPFLFRVSFEELKARAIHVEIDGSAFLAMGNNDLLVYLCIHGQLHRWSRLKWLCDIVALINAMEEDGLIKAKNHAQSQGLSPKPVFGTALRLCDGAFKMDLQEFEASLASGPWIENQKRKTWGLWLRPRGAKGLKGVFRRWDEMWTCLKINPSLRGSVHELLRLCASPYDLGRINLPDSLFYLYLPLRPIFLLMSRFDNKVRKVVSTKHNID